MSDESWQYGGRWALVTGASAGIGERFAHALAARGMNLVLAARREDALRRVAAELSAEYRVHTQVAVADLSKPGAAGVLWMEASDGRQIHLLVNNAGFGLKGEFRELPAARQVEMVKVNCVAPMELAHLAIREMWSNGGGAVINVASVAGYLPIPSLATYAATKAFLISLSEALEEECRATGIRVVTLNPGPVQTEFQSVAGTSVNDRTLGVRTTEEVVAAALARLDSGGGTVTPGLSNRLSALLARMAPRGLVVKTAKAMYQRLR
jgi:uncharacterized protein